MQFAQVCCALCPAGCACGVLMYTLRAQLFDLDPASSTSTVRNQQLTAACCQIPLGL